MDRIIIHSALLLASWLIAGCTAISTPEKEASHPQTSTDEFQTAEAKSLIQSGALILDVRTPEEFALGHLAGAQNIPHTQILSRISAAAPDKAKPIVVYCKSGHRAEIAREDLMELGYRQVVNGGGMAGLK